uniref:Uncharacterized protein n=1 Tax=Glycine max TaxID=3847 RepID=A0A0R0GIU7_SOYBN
MGLSKQKQKKGFGPPTSISRGRGSGSSSPFASPSFTPCSSLPCSSLPFTPWVIAAGCCVQLVTRGWFRGWLQGSWLVPRSRCVEASRVAAAF